MKRMRKIIEIDEERCNGCGRCILACAEGALKPIDGKGRTVAIACPKLDDIEKHIARLTEILVQATPETLTIVHMEVPCCTGLVHAAIEATLCSGKDIPLKHIVIGRSGAIMTTGEVRPGKPDLAHM